MRKQFTQSFQNFGAITLIALLSIATSSVLGQSKQVLGSFSTMDGGFEGQAASGTGLSGTTIGTGVQRTDWTCGTASYGTVKTASPRTGAKYINVNLTGGTKRIQSPTAAANALAAYTLVTTGTTTSGSSDITAVASTTGAQVGMGISGTGIPAGSTITAIGTGTFTISAAATASGTITLSVDQINYTVQYYYRTTGTTNVGGAIQYMGASADGTNPTSAISYTVLGNMGKGTTTSGSNVVTVYAPSTPNAIVVGGTIGGIGIPDGTTVVSYDLTAATVTLSANATITGTNVILSTLPIVGTNNLWSKLSTSVTVASSTTAAPQYGYVCILRTNVAMATAMDIDDVVMYAGALDVTAPDVVTTPTAPTTSPSQMVVSWTAPATGVDGGGYMVVRSTVADPTAIPNVNGIYAVGNTVSDGIGNAGTVVYLGTNPTFTDISLGASTKYYYRIYTVDKAFNYSSAVAVNGTTDVGTSLALIKNSDISFDGKTIKNPNHQTLKLYDALGRLVETSNGNINMSSASKGVYVIKTQLSTLKIAL
jgi:hypothetical protein